MMTSMARDFGPYSQLLNESKEPSRPRELRLSHHHVPELLSAYHHWLLRSTLDTGWWCAMLVEMKWIRKPRSLPISDWHSLPDLIGEGIHKLACTRDPILASCDLSINHFRR